MKLFWMRCLIAVIATALPMFALAETPLVRSSEQSSTRLCLDYDQSNKQMVPICRAALTEFGHTDFELAKLHNNLGYGLVEIGKEEQGLEHLNTAISLNAAYAAPWKNIGWMHWDHDEYDAAYSAFENAYKLNAGEVSLVGMASSLWRGERDYDTALKLFERVELIDPKYEWAISDKAWMFLQQSKLEDAKTAFNRAIELRPRRANNYFGMSKVLEKQDDLPGALKAVDKAVQNNDTNVRYLSMRAFINRRLKHYGRAVVDAERAMELEPTSDNSVVAAAWAYSAIGRSRDAIEVFQKAEETGVDSSYFYYNFADFLSDEGKWKASLEKIDKSIAAKEADEYDHNLRAYILLKLEDPKRALTAAQTALELEPSFTDALQNVAYAQVELNEPINAFTSIMKAHEAGISEEDLSNFIGYLIDQKRYLLAARVRAQVTLNATE